MQIVEIFKSIDGEGPRVGKLATFVRTYGCPLRCTYCDSHYAIEGNQFTDMSVDAVVTAIEGYGCKNVTLTGGEPLIQKDAFELVDKLYMKGYSVQIETCGAVDFSQFLYIPNVMITMDWKSHSSGMTDRMKPELLSMLRPYDVLKFVVGSREDLDQMLEVSKNTSAKIYISPIFGMIKPVEIVDYMLEHNLDERYTAQVQLHKIIWDPNARGV